MIGWLLLLAFGAVIAGTVLAVSVTIAALYLIVVVSLITAQILVALAKGAVGLAK